MSPCRLCGAASEHAFVTTDRNRRISEERFSYRRCLRCGSVFLADIPPDLERYYPAAYHRLPQPDDLARSAAGERYKLDRVLEHADGGHLIEIGPSVGAFAFLAREAGFEVTAVEMDRACCDYLEAVVGVRAICSTEPERALEDAGPARVVVMWQVIEHLARPRECVEAAARNLAAGGALIVSTPNPAGVQARVLGPRWPHVDAPRHLSLIPPPALVETAADAGLELVSLDGDDPGARACNRFGWENVFTRPRPGVVTSALAQLRVGPGLALALAPLERHRLRGGTYTAVFRRPAA
jgi:hypothetical protein